RSLLDLHNQLMALLPVSTTYRIPPQLLLDGSSYAEVAALNQPPDTAFTAEFWLYPTSTEGTFLELGTDFSWRYSTQAETTTLTLTVKNDSVTATIPAIQNGYPHHLAFSWDSQVTNENSILYLDGTPVFSATLAARDSLSSTNLIIGQGFTGSLDEIRLWQTVRDAAQISETLTTSSGPFITSDSNLLTIQPGAQADLIGYWPVGDTDSEILSDLSGNQNNAILYNQATIGFKPLYTLYHTSAPVTEEGVGFTAVSTPGVQTLTVSADNPLILFNLDVSLEWDGRNDTLFLQQLEDSIRRASAILYDVTNGQVALGQINLFHDKAYWGAADIVIFADNSLRPSAAIGGVVNTSFNDPDIADANYLPGQIRMGTSWDPYGENIADLGEDWTRALAHELSHYLLFLPDNYLGVEDGIFQRVVCPGSFMTTTSDPSFSEFLTRGEWKDGCTRTLAQETTGRTDWETINRFYPMLQEPENPPVGGPPDLPLNVTHLVPWASIDGMLPFPERNFDIRDQEQERLRLPTAQAFLIKTSGSTTPDPDNATSLEYLEDDRVIALGTPTGGGDRLSVRGAEPGDRLCLFDTQENQFYAGCIEAVSANTVAIPALPLHPDFPEWQPNILAYAASPYTISVTVTQALLPGEQLFVQLYPTHYGSVAGNAPAALMVSNNSNSSHTQILTTRLPAYEFAVRIWVEDNDSCLQTNNDPENFTCLREAITVLRLNPENWEIEPPDAETAESIHTPQLYYTPFAAGPDWTAIGGPDWTAIGGPDWTAIGGPDWTAIGGPDWTAIGGPDWTAIGGPDWTAIGGAIFIGNPDWTAIGGPDWTAIGGTEQILLGSANSISPGGASLLGNANSITMSSGDNSPIGAASRTLNAPILSADAQVVIYSRAGFFADNGVESLQALATIPEQTAHPWLVPVGQAYRVKLSEQETERFISFTYLQREVPEGYEHTLKIYFLPEGGTSWELITNTVGLVENLIVGPLKNEDGTYAVMASLDDMPPLTANSWNLLAYPLPDIRCVFVDCDPDGKLADAIENNALTEAETAVLNTSRAQCSDDALASINFIGLVPSNGTNQIPALLPNEMQDPVAVEALQPGHVYWIYITEGPDMTPQFAPPRRLPDGTLPNCTELINFVADLPATPP
ncbi:MAG: LamG domain-containing protein, partial [Ardenticatenaceae bacterium]|nr:LamG domain-containing protein [Ardenticatenaceae bacterium]